MNSGSAIIVDVMHDYESGPPIEAHNC